jgi:hypothetical protein
VWGVGGAKVPNFKSKIFLTKLYERVCTDRSTDGQLNAQTDGWMNGQTDGRADNGRKDGWTERKDERQSDKLADRQRNTLTNSRFVLRPSGV